MKSQYNKHELWELIKQHAPVMAQIMLDLKRAGMTFKLMKARFK